MMTKRESYKASFDSVFFQRPDSEHCAVVWGVNEALLNSLRALRDTFSTLASDPSLHAHEYRWGSLYDLQLDDDLDAPDTVVELQSHLNELETKVRIERLYEGEKHEGIRH